MEGNVNIYLLYNSRLGRGSNPSTGGVQDKSQLSALCIRQITMAEILSRALKENQCKGLLRLIAGLTDGAGRPKFARILRLAYVKGKLLYGGALIKILRRAITNSKAGRLVAHGRPACSIHSADLRFLLRACERMITLRNQQLDSNLSNYSLTNVIIGARKYS
jgi:hypothetical protein